MKESFVRENDMIEPIISSVNEFTDTKEPWTVFLECVGSPGIADVVFAEFDHTAIQKRIDSGLKPLEKAVQVRTLFSLHTEIATDLTTVARNAGYSPGYVRSTLSKLLEMGFVIKSNNGYLKSPDYQPVLKRVVAIEAKLSDWTRGLYQARRYLRFANRVFLALDEVYSHRVLPYHEKISFQHIGLSLVSACSSRASVYSKPDWHSPLSTVEHALVGERLWSIINKKESTKSFGFLWD